MVWVYRKAGCLYVGSCLLVCLVVLLLDCLVWFFSSCFIFMFASLLNSQLVLSLTHLLGTLNVWCIDRLTASLVEWLDAVCRFSYLVLLVSFVCLVLPCIAMLCHTNLLFVATKPLKKPSTLHTAKWVITCHNRLQVAFLLVLLPSSCCLLWRFKLDVHQMT